MHRIAINKFFKMTFMFIVQILVFFPSVEMKLIIHILSTINLLKIILRFPVIQLLQGNYQLRSFVSYLGM